MLSGVQTQAKNQDKAQAPDAFKIDVAEIKNGTMPKPFLQLVVSGKNCELKNVQTGKNKTLSAKSCAKAKRDLQPYLAKPVGPGDYANPKVDYFEVIVTVQNEKWSRIAQQQQVRQCEIGGKCQEPAKPVAWKIAKIITALR